MLELLAFEHFFSIYFTVLTLMSADGCLMRSADFPRRLDFEEILCAEIPRFLPLYVLVVTLKLLLLSFCVFL